ncbi:MAG: DUF1801 domain-containing protein [Bacteroidota bacterium]
MQYDVSAPLEYIETLAPDWRKEVVMKLRETLLEYGLTESIEYKMLAYRYGDQSIFHLNAQKNYVSLYVGDTKKIDPSGSMLKGLDLGKGCIRFRKNDQTHRINVFIKKAVELFESGADIGC